MVVPVVIKQTSRGDVILRAEVAKMTKSSDEALVVEPHIIQELGGDCDASNVVGRSSQHCGPQPRPRPRGDGAW